MDKHRCYWCDREPPRSPDDKIPTCESCAVYFGVTPVMIKAEFVMDPQPGNINRPEDN